MSGAATDGCVWADVSVQDGNTPLHHAAGNSNAAMVQALLAAGVDINAKNKVSSPNDLLPGGRHVRSATRCLIAALAADLVN
jgi:ankyrin repeat protein